MMAYIDQEQNFEQDKSKKSQHKQWNDDGYCNDPWSSAGNSFWASCTHVHVHYSDEWEEEGEGVIYYSIIEKKNNKEKADSCSFRPYISKTPHGHRGRGLHSEQSCHSRRLPQSI